LRLKLAGEVVKMLMMIRRLGPVLGTSTRGADRVAGDTALPQSALALMPQPLHHRGERRFLLCVRRDPAEAHAECGQIGVHRRLGLLPGS
jgi:hypothetical protein